MPSSTLLSLFRYKAWADGELLDALATLDAAQYGEAHHTALRIFNHIHVVDAIFKANLLGERHGFTATNTPETPTLAMLRSHRQAGCLVSGLPCRPEPGRWRGRALVQLRGWRQGADEPRGDAAASGDPRRLSQGGHRAASGAVRHHAAARYPDHLFGRRGDAALADDKARP